MAPAKARGMWSGRSFEIGQPAWKVARGRRIEPPLDSVADLLKAKTRRRACSSATTRWRVGCSSRSEHASAPAEASTAAAGAFPRMTNAFLMCFQTMKKVPS